MPDFLLQTLSGVIAAVLGALIIAMIPVATRAERWKSAPKVVAKNVGGVQVIADEIGDNTQIDVDNSRQIVVQNIESSAPPAAKEAGTSDTNDTIWVVGIVAVVAAGLFLSFHLILFWLSIAICVGLILALAIAVVRATRYRLWDRGGAVVVFEVITSIAVAAWAWIGVATVTWHGETIGSISQRIVQEASAHNPPGSLSGEVFNALIAPGLQLFKMSFQNPVLMPLALTLLGAVVCSMLAVVLSWDSLFGWLAYMGFVFGRTKSRRLAKRAVRYQDRKWGGVILGQLVFCLLAILLASGILLSLLESNLPAAQL